MILIASGAFISSEFQVELGRLPPALVPLGNKRLYEHQVSAIREIFPNEEIYLSLTDAYTLRNTDALLIDKLNITIVTVPNGLLLGESLLYVINSIGKYDETFRLLHGDTLIRDFPIGEDIVMLAKAEDEYPWEFEDSADNKIWCGYFSFSDIKLFAKSLLVARGQFSDSVRSYQKVRRQENPVSTTWLDLGHVNTYFRARASVTTQRAFNELEIANGVVKKSSQQTKKIEAEANWFQNLPSNLKRYVPQLISGSTGSARKSYELEYLALLPLNELFVHGNLMPIFWMKIFQIIENLLCDFSSLVIIEKMNSEDIESDYKKLVIQKTNDRIKRFAHETGSSITQRTKYNGRMLPSIAEIIKDCQESALRIPPRQGVLHGDMCFSNILYDSRTNNVKLIDPRGMTSESEMVILGDLRYDIAKFAHSVIGLYDHIVAGLFSLEERDPLSFKFTIHTDEETNKVQRYFFEQQLILGISAKQITPLVILLFLSMLPLHSDKPLKQRAFLANSLRLYSNWKE